MVHIAQMAILKIARMGHPILHEIATPVTDPTGSDIASLVDDMLETLQDSGGIGLAAPQVHVSKRVVIFFVPEERSEEGDDGHEIDLTIMINPKIEPLSVETNLDWEACLSVPKLMGSVERYSHIKYSWSSLDGVQQVREAKGFHARAVQHECDHLDGKLYPMRMTDFTTFGFDTEIHQNLQLINKGRSVI